MRLDKITLLSCQLLLCRKQRDELVRAREIPEVQKHGMIDAFNSQLDNIQYGERISDCPQENLRFKIKRLEDDNKRLGVLLDDAIMLATRGADIVKKLNDYILTIEGEK